MSEPIQDVTTPTQNLESRLWERAREYVGRCPRSFWIIKGESRQAPLLEIYKNPCRR